MKKILSFIISFFKRKRKLPIINIKNPHTIRDKMFSEMPMPTVRRVYPNTIYSELVTEMPMYTYELDDLYQDMIISMKMPDGYIVNLNYKGKKRELPPKTIQEELDV